ncbi:MAG TPA: 30S ribosomal protein S2 [Terrimicrobiaceae bacterium]
MTELLEAGVHYGHQTKRWNPKMRDYILEEKNSIYIIDLSITVEQLASAARYLGEVVKGGGKILFVGTKKQAQEAVREAAEVTGQFFVNQRWLGGTLTNLQTIRRSVARLREFEEMEKTPAFARMNKQETSALRREATKLRRNLEGLLNMERLPDALVIIDTNREEIAVAEAARLKIPVVAIVDTNCDPEKIAYPIAGNDDAIRSIRVILQKLVDSIVEGQGVRVKSETANELAAVSE